MENEDEGGSGGGVTGCGAAANRGTNTGAHRERERVLMNNSFHKFASLLAQTAAQKWNFLTGRGWEREEGAGVWSVGRVEDSSTQKHPFYHTK